MIRVLVVDDEILARVGIQSILENCGDIRVAGAFLLAPIVGVAAVWYAVPVGWTVNFLISFVRYLTGKWGRRNLVEAEPAR